MILELTADFRDAVAAMPAEHPKRRAVLDLRLATGSRDIEHGVIVGNGF